MLGLGRRLKGKTRDQKQCYGVLGFHVAYQYNSTWSLMTLLQTSGGVKYAIRYWCSLVLNARHQGGSPAECCVFREQRLSLLCAAGPHRLCYLCILPSSSAGTGSSSGSAGFTVAFCCSSLLLFQGTLGLWNENGTFKIVFCIRTSLTVIVPGRNVFFLLGR